MRKELQTESGQKIITENVKGYVDKGKYYSVIEHLLGIEEETIRIVVEKEVVMFSWSDGIKNTHKKVIHFPGKVRLCRKKFEDGTLEILFEKIGN
jgi:hypothetical protein